MITKPEVLRAIIGDARVMDHCETCQHLMPGQSVAEGRGYIYACCTARSMVPIMVKYTAGIDGACGPDGKLYERKGEIFKYGPETTKTISEMKS